MTHRTHTFFSCCLLASKAAPLLFCFLFFFLKHKIRPFVSDAKEGALVQDGVTYLPDFLWVSRHYALSHTDNHRSNRMAQAGDGRDDTFRSRHVAKNPKLLEWLAGDDRSDEGMITPMYPDEWATYRLIRRRPTTFACNFNTAAAANSSSSSLLSSSFLSSPWFYQAAQAAAASVSVSASPSASASASAAPKAILEVLNKKITAKSFRDYHPHPHQEEEEEEQSAPPLTHDTLPSRVIVTLGGCKLHYRPERIEWMLSACSTSVTGRLRASDMVTDDCGDLLRMISLVKGFTWNDFPNGLVHFDAPLTVFRSPPPPPQPPQTTTQPVVNVAFFNLKRNRNDAPPPSSSSRITLSSGTCCNNSISSIAATIFSSSTASSSSAATRESGISPLATTASSSGTGSVTTRSPVLHPGRTGRKLSTAGRTPKRLRKQSPNPKQQRPFPFSRRRLRFSP